MTLSVMQPINLKVRNSCLVFTNSASVKWHIHQTLSGSIYKSTNSGDGQNMTNIGNNFFTQAKGLTVKKRIIATCIQRTSLLQLCITCDNMLSAQYAQRLTMILQVCMFSAIYQRLFSELKYCWKFSCCSLAMYLT